MVPHTTDAGTIPDTVDRSRYGMESGHNQGALYRRFSGLHGAGVRPDGDRHPDLDHPRPAKSGGGERGAASRRDSDRHP